MKRRPILFEHCTLYRRGSLFLSNLIVFWYFQPFKTGYDRDKKNSKHYAYSENVILLYTVEANAQK